ncbi:MAG: chitinase, partial [Gammaproteobacteria bacterium]|nr:chitinase [Gammaproteobacteria bacterium]
MTSPAAGSSATVATSININANAADIDGTIAKVEFFAGATKLGEDTAAPFVQAWTPTVAGLISLTARAIDNKGLATTSAMVSVTVNAAPPPPPPPPTSSITPSQADAGATAH